jgi:hypothetical protein
MVSSEMFSAGWPTAVRYTSAGFIYDLVSYSLVFETPCAALHPVLDQIRPDELDHPSIVVAVR